jgi:hypothetical protein
VTDYRMQHRPAGLEGAPLHDVTANGVLPKDFYQRPHEYPAHHSSDGEAVSKIFEARGRPDRSVWIYRAVPRGVRIIAPGDWVAITKSYARDEGRHPSKPSEDMEVITAKVRAKDIHTSGDSIQEWGYNGSAGVKGTVVFRPRREKTYEELILDAARKKFAKAIKWTGKKPETFVDLLPRDIVERIMEKAKKP